MRPKEGSCLSLSVLRNGRVFLSFLFSVFLSYFLSFFFLSYSLSCLSFVSTSEVYQLNLFLMQKKNLYVYLGLKLNLLLMIWQTFQTAVIHVNYGLQLDKKN